MSAVRRIAKNATLLYIARIAGTLLRIFLYACIARLLGDAVLGKFSFAVIFTSFFSILISLGMEDLLAREVSRDKASAAKYLGNILAMRLILSVIVFALMAAVIEIMDSPLETRMAVFLFGGYSIFTSLGSLFRANFRAFEKMEWEALLEINEALFTTSLGLLLLFNHAGLIELCFIFFLASLINFILGFTICNRKFTRIRLAFDSQFWKSIAIKAFPFGIIMFFLIYPRVDIILLSNMKGDATVGIYNAAYQIVLAFDPLAITLMNAIVPVISRLFLSSKPMLQLAYEKSIKYLVMFGLPISAGGMVLANRIIPFLYGDQYLPSILALQILVWNCLLICINRPMLFMLGTINRQGSSAVIALAAMMLSIGLNLILIPQWNYVGSSIISLLTGTLVTIAGWYAISRYTGSKLNILKLIARPAIASLIMGTVIYLVNHIWGNLPGLILLGIIIYAAVLASIGGLAVDDRYLMRQAIRFGQANSD